MRKENVRKGRPNRKSCPRMSRRRNCFWYSKLLTMSERRLSLGFPATSWRYLCTENYNDSLRIITLKRITQLHVKLHLADVWIKCRLLEHSIAWRYHVLVMFNHITSRFYHQWLQRMSVTCVMQKRHRCFMNVLPVLMKILMHDCESLLINKHF